MTTDGTSSPAETPREEPMPGPGPPTDAAQDRVALSLNSAAEDNSAEGQAVQTATWRVPTWDQALASKQVPFEMVITCWFQMQESFEADASNREAATQYIELLLNEFANAHKGTRYFYYGSNAPLGVALTNDNQLHYVCDLSATSVPVQDILRKAQNLADEARQYLSDSSTELEIVTARLFRVAADALSTLDSSDPKAPDRPVLEQLQVEFSDATDYYRRRVQRDAQGAYLGGLFIGMVVIAIAIAVLELLARGQPLAGLSLGGLVCGASGGGLGAGLSVLTRITHGKMRIDHHSGNKQIVIFGAVRPLIGGVFGIAAYAITAAGVLSGTTATPSGAAWLAIGFASGFSERFAQDMLTSPHRPTPLAVSNH